MSIWQPIPGQDCTDNPCPRCQAARDEREIVARFRVQPNLNVCVEDSGNILLELTTADGGQVTARSDVIGNVDQLKFCLDQALVRAAVLADEAEQDRMAGLREVLAARRPPRSGYAVTP